MGESGRSWKGIFGRGGRSDSAEASWRRVLEINRALAGEHHAPKLYGLILDASIELTGAERAFLILSEGDGGAGRVVASRNVDREEVRSAATKISQTVVQKVVAGRASVRTDSAQEDRAIGPSHSIAELKLRSILALPLELRDRVIGCLYLDNRFQHGTFTDEHVGLMEMFADQAAVAVDNVTLHEENRQARKELERLNSQLAERLQVQQVELESMRTVLEQQHRRVALAHEYPELVGRSPAMMELLGLLDVVVDTEYPILITGESGTGKEIVARTIHRYSARRAGPFVAVNCTAIAESLLEAELFGYEKGAFTGADRSRPGLFEEAHGGTLFLDEIGDTDLSMQRKLLRVLQEGEFRKVGGRDSQKVDVRIVSATNADLPGRLEDGSFREDLYYRLKGVAVRVPPLRERRSDIPALVQHFLAEIAEQSGRPAPKVEEAALAAMTSYSWPGNVRELRNEVRRLSAMAADVVDASMVRNLGHGTRPAHLPLAGRTLADLEKEAIEQALEAARGKRVEAARMLGLPRRTFYNRLKRYGLG